MDLQALAHEGQQLQQPLHGHTAEAGSIAAATHILPPAQTHMSANDTQAKHCQAMTFTACLKLCDQPL